jgi:D-alanyl-D-alanine carboxypeptidase
MSRRPPRPRRVRKDFGRYRRRRLVAAAILLLLVGGLSLALMGLSSEDEAELRPVAETGERAPAETGAAPAGEPAERPEPPSEEPEPEGEASGPPPPGSCDDLLVLVDHDHALPPGYAPDDMVSLNAYGVPTLGGDQFLRAEAAKQLARLVSDAAAAGEELVVASSYRSYHEQQESHARWTAYYGEGAGGVSAVPGHSEHQLGTAVDFTNSAAGYELWWPFGDTTASAWLEENAAEYGFVLSYPRGKEEETGYQWEPWHYRYVGPENARALQERDQSLRGFLLEEGVKPGC